jgi:hypothetical protein
MQSNIIKLIPKIVMITNLGKLIGSKDINGDIANDVSPQPHKIVFCILFKDFFIA